MSSSFETSGFGIEDIWINTVETTQDGNICSPPMIRLLALEQLLFKPLIDTGAGPNLISKQIMDKYNWEYQRVENINLWDLSHLKTDIVGKVVLPCIYNNDLFNIKWWVTNQMIPFPILGRQGLDVLMTNWK